jgi:acetoin utilization deacetylase AcuC-like enzyme
MSTLKVDTYLTRGGASEIAIDKLKGVTAAGSMLVVGEGGTNTTNLQQGLAKHWVNYDSSDKQL